MHDVKEFNNATMMWFFSDNEKPKRQNRDAASSCHRQFVPVAHQK